jgi:chromosome segregation ATPase
MNDTNTPSSREGKGQGEQMKAALESTLAFLENLSDEVPELYQGIIGNIKAALSSQQQEGREDETLFSVERLERYCGKLKLENLALQHQITTLQEQLKEENRVMVQQMFARDAEIEALKADLEKYKGYYSDVSNTLQAAELDVEWRKEDIERLQSELKQANEKAAEVAGKANVFSVGDKIKAVRRYGRLEEGKVYEVLKITKDGHVIVQTKWGKTHYAKEQFVNS